MSYVIKTEPFEAALGAMISLSEPSLYGGETISVGAEVFIWFSETKQGNGLAWLSLVERVTHSNPPNVTVRLIDSYQGAGFGIAQLEPYRYADDETPIASITKKLYSHSHEKIAHLTSEEADLLRTQFVIAQQG